MKIYEIINELTEDGHEINPSPLHQQYLDVYTIVKSHVCTVI